MFTYYLCHLYSLLLWVYFFYKSAYIPQVARVNVDLWHSEP